MILNEQYFRKAVEKSRGKLHKARANKESKKVDFASDTRQLKSCVSPNMSSVKESSYLDHISSVPLHSNSVPSRSATKRMNDPEKADIKIHVRCFDSEEVSLSENAKSDCRFDTYNGIKFMPLGIKKMLEHMKHRNLEVDQSWFKKEPEHDISHIQFWKRVESIWERTPILINDRALEGAWNNQIHSPLLDLALTGY